MEDKTAIARLAASFVHDGDCIFLDGGTTIAPMIDFIQDKRIKIVTHNPVSYTHLAHGYLTGLVSCAGLCAGAGA